MWGSVYVDYSIHKNFNIGFSSHKNDISIHLSQWQYWWWFWFALVWALYFLLILRLYVSKTENFNITLNTSMKSHGKWGDFLVAIIPLSWCGNILINSNFILRMIEWQNESSLFVVRIQGKQWYWVYKYNSDTNYRINNVYLNVGNNNWLKSTNQSTLNFNYNNSTLGYVFDYEFKGLHKKILDQKGKSANSFYSSKPYSSMSSYLQKITNTQETLPSQLTYYDFFKFSNGATTDAGNYRIDSNVADNLIDFSKKTEIQLDKNAVTTKSNADIFTARVANSNTLFETDKLDIVEESLENLRTKTSKFPIKLNKGVLNKHNISVLNSVLNLKSNVLFNYKINNTDITEKMSQVEQFWGFRQKRYKKLRSFSFPVMSKFNSATYSYMDNFVNDKFDKYQAYTAVKNNKYRNESIPVSLARRLLRTKRTLILPAHINITLITGSYDVVHSWFIPGLGLKMDCVPGRSTHHSLYIDNIGFYYGQCAEICGRYHHHMPIRVCALPFEHFLLWWQTKGLPRMYRSKAFLENKSILLNKLT